MSRIEANLALIRRFYDPLVERGVTRERPVREAANDAELVAA